MKEDPVCYCKYTQNKVYRSILLRTGRERLVEYTRWNPEKKFWAAQVVNGGKRHAGGRIVGGEEAGNNFMGKCMMAIRS